MKNITKTLDSPSEMQLMVVDIQEKLFPSMNQQAQERVLASMRIMGTLADIFRIPVLVTEQYPKGLGPTVEPVIQSLPEHTVKDKLTFNCMKDEAIAGHMKETGKKTVLVTGMETHICVFQTVTSLLEEGYTVIPVTDALASRRDMHWQWALEAFTNMRAFPAPAETLAFMLLERSGTSEFKRISQLLKELP